jgi:hypothetical protein
MRTYNKELEIIASDILDQNAEAIGIETDFSIIFRFEKSWCSFQNIDAIPYGK